MQDKGNGLHGHQKKSTSRSTVDLFEKQKQDHYRGSLKGDRNKRTILKETLAVRLSLKPETINDYCVQPLHRVSLVTSKVKILPHALCTHNRSSFREFDQSALRSTAKYGAHGGYYGHSSHQNHPGERSHALFTKRRDSGLNGVLGCAITRARDEQGRRICTVVFLAFTSRRRKEMLPIINHCAETLMKMVQKKVANEESMDMKKRHPASSHRTRS
ncbi:hypothetical protein Y1Q_0008339 [Alligator mississippiensis]|uniref:Uncharacterized protein n=1 Tax=Alligator mississippiensis TaxID=8496 RepID=A0A151N1X6_ALLMI|nr:hypothetical protein Y1Q_0008339 [Alligator mississippiensis]